MTATVPSQQSCSVHLPRGRHLCSKGALRHAAPQAPAARGRLLLPLALGIAMALLLVAAPAHAVKIRIKGTAHIAAVASAEAEGFVVRGELTDDVGVPIPQVPLIVSATATDSKQAVQLPPPLACEPTGRGKTGVRHPRADEYRVETDDHGTFCVRATGSLSRGRVKLRFAGSKVYEAVDEEVPIDEGTERLARTVLRFESAPEDIDLDDERVSIIGSLRIDRSEQSRLLQDAPTRREGLPVVLEDERGTRLGEALTGGDGRARFEVPTRTLGDPGHGELRMRFDASGALARSTATQGVLRHATVRLEVPQPPAPQNAEDGIPIEVLVTAARGVVADGIVEARRGADSVGTGRVQGGKATVVVSFPADRAGTVPLSLRYVPSSPWWHAGSALELGVAVSGPGVLRQVALGLLVAAAAAWVVAGWRRAPKRLAPLGADRTTIPPSGRAGVQVLGATSGQSDWRGTVSDAHEGTPIARARLRIVLPSFQGTGVVAEVVSDDGGTFVLELPAEHATRRPDARLVVESELHSTFEQALPAPSVLAVALVTRRRALLERLVRWARRSGTPYDGPPEPTPGHVRRVAARGDAAEVEAWARRVENAAFGNDPVDAAHEEEVRAAEPRGRGPG